jgi:DNA (cytosine-5)-methyltransferase 1
MIDKGFNKTRLREEAGISSNAMAKLGKNESVKVEVLAKICNHLDCTMDDIMEVLTDKEEA